MARVSGGDGHILAYRWRLAGGRYAYTRSVTAAPWAPLRVTAYDAAGGSASAVSVLPRRWPKGVGYTNQGASGLAMIPCRHQIT